MKKLVFVPLLFVLILTVGCRVPVTGVALNVNTTTIPVGATEQLAASVEPTGVTDQAVTWQSNDVSVATVDSSGLVTAIAIGSAVITVTTTVQPTDATEKSVSWQSSDETVATVDSTGLVTAIASGAAMTEAWRSRSIRTARS